jgi:hypothetical protein
MQIRSEDGNVSGVASILGNSPSSPLHEYDRTMKFSNLPSALQVSCPEDGDQILLQGCLLYAVLPLVLTLSTDLLTA